MKTAVLVSSFGTSYEDARRNSLDRIFYDLKSAAGYDSDISFYQAYTSGMIIKKLAAGGVHIDTVKEALDKIVEEGVERLIVVPTHILAGIEYRKLSEQVMEYRSEFKQIKITKAVIEDAWDCVKLAGFLSRTFRFRSDKEYILMGHGSESAANERYKQMNSTFENAGLTNVRIATVEAEPDIDDVLDTLKLRNNKKPVVLYPFMVVAGEHAHNDMAGEKDSFASKLKDAGYEVEINMNGLGEYADFRMTYVNKLKEIL